MISTKKKAGTYDFAYSVGYIRTMETLLLNENEVERMMLSKDAKEAFKILNEFDMADNKGVSENPAEFQKIINEDLKQTKDILERISPDQEVLNILWHKYDFHNIKTLFKAKLGKKSLDSVRHLLVELGTIPVESLISFIMDNQDAPFYLREKREIYLKKKLRQLEPLFEKNHRNPLIIDLYLDQKFMKIVHTIAKDNGNQFLQNYVKKLVDLSNIKTFFRMRTQKKDWEMFEIAFLYHGGLPLAKFSSAYKTELGQSIEAFRGTDYAKAVSEGYRHYEEEKTFIYMEKEMENYLTDYIKRAKLITFGPEPLIAYFLAKRNNAFIVRMIMIHKLNNIDPEEIRTRLRTLYV